VGFAALAKTADFPLLDSYQLVKHYLGLVSTYPERALTLVYLYWEPRNADREPVFGAHRAEVTATGTTLMDLHGIGPSGAARLLVEVGDITRFPSCGHFASWNGTAPIDASSGEQIGHRLSRAGNRQINRVLHIMATVQLRNRTEGRAYFDRKTATGKTSMEAMRSLKRRPVRPRRPADARRHGSSNWDGPGGHRGTTPDSSVTGSHLQAGSSDKSLPGPATSQPKTPLQRAG
jgi:transposase